MGNLDFYVFLATFQITLKTKSGGSKSLPLAKISIKFTLKYSIPNKGNLNIYGLIWIMPKMISNETDNEKIITHISLYRNVITSHTNKRCLCIWNGEDCLVIWIIYSSFYKYLVARRQTQLENDAQLCRICLCLISQYFKINLWQ